jgi:predicted amidohydrolase YtcJ
MQILYHANIHTLCPNNPRAQAIAIHQDKIVAVGTNYDLLSNYSQVFFGNDQTTALDMGGLTILPGLTDAHIHLEQYSLNLQRVDCETETKSDCLQRVAERVTKTPPGEWILGHGWNQNNWEQGFGSALELDQVAPQNPVYLTAKSLHASWANTLALQVSGISASTPDPEGGQIQRDKRNQPTGIFLESAVQLFSDHLPQPTLPKITAAIQEALPGLWQMGLTGLHDFDSAECFSALQSLKKNNLLIMRVVKSIPRENLSNAIAMGLRSGYGDKTLQIGNVKLFADGALGPRTAAMIQPYIDETENLGLLFISENQLFEIGKEVLSHGLGLAVHAIGDRANHEILNGYSRLYNYFREIPEKPHNRIEHVQLLNPQDASRLGEMGIIASMQPIHATSDMIMAERFWGEQSKTAYAWKLLLDNKTTLAFGSDAPVESPNPFWGLHAAVTRQRQDGSPRPEGWYPNQKIGLYQALLGYTKGPAVAADREKELGCLSPGYLADLCVLPEDPFACHPSEIKDLLPLATMIGGRWVYSSLNM